MVGRDPQVIDKVREAIQSRMTFPLNQLGVIRKFNGVNAIQARHYTHLHCERYIEQIVEHHGWTKEFIRNKPVPLRSDSKYMAAIQMDEGPNG